MINQIIMLLKNVIIIVLNVLVLNQMTVLNVIRIKISSQ